MDLIEPLTQREQEVLALLAEGLSNQEIADTLIIRLATVQHHLHSIYGKLGVTSRLQAVRKATKLNLI